MAVQTNTVNIAYSREETLGNLPASPSWKNVEPNDISTFGATITTVARAPISQNRQNQKGTTTDLDSSVEFPADLTIDSFLDFAEAYVFSTFSAIPGFEPSGVTASGYTVAAGGDLDEDTLVFARGYSSAANNGLKVVGAGSTTTNIAVTGLTVEASPPQGARVDVCGVRGASGDIEVDSDGNIISTTLDFTSLNLTPGQAIFVGGSATANQFSEAANRGIARVRVIETNKLTLDKRQQDYVADTGAGKEIDLYFGPFLRNVPTSHPLYQQISHHFELTYIGLDDLPTAYEYSKGNLASALALNMPLTDKATATFTFTGLDTDPPTATRATNADSATSPTRTSAFNTTADFARLRVEQLDGTGLTTCIKSLTLNLSNDVTPEKCLGTLGALFFGIANFVVNGEIQALFTDSRIAAAVRNNTTVTMDFALQNDDGTVHIDIPSMTLGGGDKEFPVNETVRINVTGEAFEDDFFGTSIGMTHFPFMPSL